MVLILKRLLFIHFFNLKNNTITNKGEFNIISGHNPEKTLRYLKYIIQQKSNVKFNVITNNDKLNAFIIEYNNGRPINKYF